MAGYPPEADPAGGAERLCRTETEFGSENRPEVGDLSPSLSGLKGPDMERPLAEEGLSPAKVRGVARTPWRTQVL